MLLDGFLTRFNPNFEIEKGCRNDKLQFFALFEHFCVSKSGFKVFGNLPAVVVNEKDFKTSISVNQHDLYLLPIALGLL
jgi:hypothetical protein